MTEYPHLFSERELGPRIAKNRVWMTAHATQLVRDNNFSEQHVDYYAERARGGVGVITMEAMAVHPTALAYAAKVLAYDERVIPNYRRVAAAVQPHGALLFGQLWHRGRQMDGVSSRMPVWSASSVPDAVSRESPHAMTHADIDEIVAGYRVSAAHAVEAGLDGVEIAGLAHGYLLHQFLAPATNHRRDEYGGSLDNRMRLTLRIVAAVREVVPADVVVGVRINGNDGTHRGALTPEDWAGIASRLEDTGAIDYVSVSAGTYLDRMRIYGASSVPAGHQVADTAVVGSRLRLPTVAVGRISDPDMAEAILASGDADFVGMTRQLVTDPGWPEKARDGRTDEIRRCVGANWCLSALTKAPLACVQNPAVGRERTFAHEPAPEPKRIAVVGAGPAGLRAALTCASRGHAVDVFDASTVLGGRVRWIAQAPAYAEWAGIVDWLERRLRTTTARIHPGTEVTADDVVGGEFDEVVVATGSRPVRHGWTALRPMEWGPDARPVPGLEHAGAVTLDDVFRGTALAPVVHVYDDLGDRQAVLLAELLRSRGHDVTIVTRLAQVAPALSDSRDGGAVLGRIRRAGVRFACNLELTAVGDGVGEFHDVLSGERIEIDPLGSLVLNTGRVAEDDLLHELRRRGMTVHAIGDALAPRRIFNAIFEAETYATMA